jgi:hypothetical protein
MFRTVPLSIIRKFSLHRQQRYKSYKFADSLQGESGCPILILLASRQQTCMTYTIAVCAVKNPWLWTEELSETCRVSFQSKFEKLVHIVGFIIIRSSEKVGVMSHKNDNFHHHLPKVNQKEAYWDYLTHRLHYTHCNHKILQRFLGRILLSTPQNSSTTSHIKILYALLQEKNIYCNIKLSLNNALVWDLIKFTSSIMYVRSFTLQSASRQVFSLFQSEFSTVRSSASSSNFRYPLFPSGPGSSVGIANGYGLDSPGIESRWGARFSAPVQTGPRAHPASCKMVTGSFPGGKSGRGVTLTPHPLLVPLVMKAIPLLPIWAVRPIQSLSACARVYFTFTFSIS